MKIYKGLVIYQLAALDTEGFNEHNLNVPIHAESLEDATDMFEEFVNNLPLDVVSWNIDYFTSSESMLDGIKEDDLRVFFDELFVTLSDFYTKQFEVKINHYDLTQDDYAVGYTCELLGANLLGCDLSGTITFNFQYHERFNEVTVTAYVQIGLLNNSYIQHEFGPFAWDSVVYVF